MAVIVPEIQLLNNEPQTMGMPWNKEFNDHKKFSFFEMHGFHAKSNFRGGLFHKLFLFEATKRGVPMFF